MLGAVEPKIAQEADEAVADCKVYFEAIGGQETRERGDELDDFTGGQLEGSGRFSMEIVD